MTRVDTVVRGGTVVTATSAFAAAVAINGEKIVGVGPDQHLPPAENYVDASGKYVLPGAIDCHNHFDNADPYELGMKAAARAGITTVIPFATYDVANRESLPSAIERHIERLNRESVVDYSLNFILENEPYVLPQISDAFDMGVTCLKAFMTYKKRPYRMASDGFLLRAMEAIAQHGGMLQLHCENGDVISYLEDRAIEEGRTKPTDYPATCPPWAEAEAIQRAIALGGASECAIYVVHLSTEAGLRHIEAAQARGQTVMAETCPQYLLLDETEMERLGPLAKIGPPLRPADGLNQGAMWEGSAAGTISGIGSDHAPAAKELKEKGRNNIFIDNDGLPVPFGAPSIETLVPLVHSEGVVKRGLPISWMVRMLSENPARMFGLYPRKGTVQPGADADLLIIDPLAEWTIRADELMGNAGYTNYDGWSVTGKPWMTMLRGAVLMLDGELLQGSGYGEFLPAGLPTPPVAVPVR